MSDPEAPPPPPPPVMPLIGGCWVRQPDGSLEPDPTEPAPPGLPPSTPE